MNSLLSSALFASALMLGASAAGAAPLSTAPIAPQAGNGTELIHGGHRSCRSGHRHSRDGDRVRCGHHYRSSGPGVTIQLGRDRRHHDRRDHRRDRRHDR